MRASQLSSTLLIAILLPACAVEIPDGEVTSDAVTRDAAMQAAPSTTPEATLARFAGVWEVEVSGADGAALPGHTITAAAGPTGWTQSFPDRSDIPVRVIDASGDIVVYEAGPYESVLRPGVEVTVLYVTRLDGDRTSGHMTAWYEGGAEAIPVLRATTAGTKRP